MKLKMLQREDHRKRIHTRFGKGRERGADFSERLNVKRAAVCVSLKRLMEEFFIPRDERHCVFFAVQGLEVVQSTPGKHAV